MAVGYASNAVGTINDVRAVVGLAHAAGALAYVDAVHYAPHGPIDVQALDCDFLVCSTYKFFGPQLGVLYGKQAALERLPQVKVRPAQRRRVRDRHAEPRRHRRGAGGGGISGGGGPDVRRRICRALAGLQRPAAGTEDGVERHSRVRARPGRPAAGGVAGNTGLKVWGITDEAGWERRVPTLSFTLQGFTPRQVAEYLGEQGIFVWDGDFYAQALIERLGLYETGGVVRVGLAHYNTAEEVDRLLEALRGL